MSVEKFTPQDHETSIYQQALNQAVESGAGYNQENVRKFRLPSFRHFAAYVENNGAKDTIIAGAEFANGLQSERISDSDFPIRRLGIMAMAGALAVESDEPAFNVVYLPNDTLNANNNQFEKSERSAIAKGDFTPYTERLHTAVSRSGLGETRLHGVGFSQGATVGAQYYTHYGHDIHPGSTFFALETPHRTTPIDFMKSGARLAENRDASAMGRDDVDFALDESGFLPWARGIVQQPSNVAVMRGLRRSDMGDIADITHQTTLAYAGESSVSSPDEHAKLATKDTIEAYEIKDNDHSVTNNLHYTTSLFVGHLKRSRNV